MRLNEIQKTIEEQLASSPVQDGSHSMQPVGIVGRGSKFLPSGELSDRLIVTFSFCLPTGKEELSEEDLALIEAIDKAIVGVVNNPDLKV